jgi:hypothetical protein
VARWPRMLVLIVALTTLGCTSSKAPTPAQETAELRIREGTLAFPKECSPRDVLNLLQGFVRAFNDGDATRLKGIFGEGFQWFSMTMGPDDHIAIYDVAKLPPYFNDRHRHAEKLALQVLEVNAGSWHGGIDIVFNVRRTADDLKQGPVNAGGKGMVRCDNKTIAVWSMGNVPVLK